MDHPYDWIYCPQCGRKTRVSIREDTVLKNFPLYCHHCKQVTLICVDEQKRIIKAQKEN